MRNLGDQHKIEISIGKKKEDSVTKKHTKSKLWKTYISLLKIKNIKGRFTVNNTLFSLISSQSISINTINKTEQKKPTKQEKNIINKRSK